MRALETSAVAIDIVDLTLTGDFTIEAWIYLDPSAPLSNNQGLVSGPTNDINFFQAGFRVFDQTNSPTDIVIADTPAQAGVWTHYAVTREAGVTRIYVNGELDATSGVNWTAPFTIAELASSFTSALDGALDEVRIWDDARSATEIEENFGRSVDPASPNLVRYYDFEGDNQFIVDRTGNAENEEELPAPTGTSLIASTAPLLPAGGVEVAIENASFEAVTLGDLQAAVGNIPGWDLSGGGMGTWNPSAAFFPGEAPDGENVAFIDNGGSISQTLTETFEAGRSYQLKVAVGNQTGGASSQGWAINLYAGTQLLGSFDESSLTPADGTFADAVLTLDAVDLTDFSAAYGEALRVEIFDAEIAGEDNAQFDDVRLYYVAGDTFDGSTPPPPTGPVDVAIANASFEAVTLGDLQAAVGDIPDWEIVSTRAGTWNPSATFFPDEAPDGENVAFIDEGGTIAQTLTETFEAGRSYQLTVAVGNITFGGDTSSSLGWEIRLYAGTQLLGSIDASSLTPAQGTFEDAILTLNAVDLTGFSAEYGQALRIEIFDAVLPGENDAQFDNVRLQYVAGDTFDGTPPPTPSTERALATDQTAIDIEDLTLSGDFTIETWLYFNAGTPISNNQGIVVGANNDLNFFQTLFRVWDGTQNIVIADTPAVAETWTHFAVTREAGVTKLFINGQLDKTSTINFTADFSVQQIASSLVGGLDGELDELRIWNAARSETEIADNYDKTVDPAAAGLLRYYGFDGTGADLIDLTGNSADLALPAGVSFVDSGAPITDGGGTGPEIISVAITNAGFEDVTLADFAASPGDVPGWVLSDPATSGTWNPRADFYSGEAPEGQNVAYLDNGGSISQTLTETFEAGRSYQLTVAVGDESNAGENLGWEVRLYAGTQLLGSVDNADFNPADDSFIDAVLTLNGEDLTGFAANYGEALRIELFDAVLAGENNAQFDNVRLDYVEADTFPEGGGNPTPSTERALLANAVSVDIPDLTLNGDFTISAWVYNTPGQTISNADGVVVGPNNDLNFFETQFRVFDGSTAERDIAISTRAETPGEWTHYSVTRENGETKIYVDGQLDVTSTVNWTNDFTIEKIAGTIFGEANGTGLTGQLDELQIWDVARTQAEIAVDLEGDIDPNSSGLLRYYDFDGTDGGVIDRTGNSVEGPLPSGANFVTSTAPFVSGPAPGGEFIDTQVVDSLFLPTDLAFLPDGRMLVIEKGGLVKIVDDPTQPGGNVETYLDLSGQTLNSEERGLLAVEVDPNFDTNGYIYFYYTKIEGGQGRTTVSRFEHQENGGGAGSRAEISTETVIWQENDVTSSCCHQGGGLSIAFEPIDASDPSPYKLYIVTSDEFTPANSQDLTNPDGKVHRVNLTDGSVPADNPYYDAAVAATYDPTIDAAGAISTSAENLALDAEGVITTIHSFGLRNGWRSSYDQESNTLFIGEVGGNNNNTSDEDIHIASPGANYGWGDGVTYPGFDGEGFLPDPNDPGNPIFSYPHLGGPGQGDSIQNGGASLTGGVVYRGDEFPDEYVGAYFYGDWVRNWIRYLEIDYSGETPTLVSDNFFKNATGQVLAFEEGPDGALYYITTFQTGNVFTFQGTVNRISFEGGNSAPGGAGIVLDPGEEANPTAPYTVTFESDVTDPDGDALSYLWSFGDGDDLDGDGIGDTATSTEANPEYTYTELGQYVVELVVTDAQGATTVFDSQIITVGNAPVPVISLPLDGGTYRAGETISLDGLANDLEDGLIDSDGRLVWSTTFQLGEIQRPGPIDGTDDAPGGISFVTPDSGNLESALNGITVFLTATDSDGLSTTTSVNLTAETAQLSFDAPIDNYTFLFDNRTEGGDFTFDSIINFNHTIEAQETYLDGGFQYTFTGWEDGETSRIRSFVTPETGQSFRPLYEITGEVGQAIQLDSSDHIDIPQLILGQGGADFTIESWVKHNDASIDNIDGIAGSNAGFGQPGATDINFFNGQVRIYANDWDGGNDPVVASHVTQPNTWTHYAIVREGGVLKIYVNGVLNVETPTTWDGAFTADHIGGTVQSGGLFGELDEWRAWNVARSETEIADNYQQALSTPQPGLVRYYQFDGDLADASGASATPDLPAAASFVASTAPVAPPATGLSIDNVTVLEGDAGAVELVFTVTRTGDLDGPAVVDFATSDGTATAGVDYTAQSGTLSFVADETTKEIRIEVFGDEDAEFDETLNVTLSNAVGGTIVKSVGVGTITNDDGDPFPATVYDAPGLMSFDGTSGTGMVVPHSDDFAIPQGTIAYSFIANDTSGDQGHFSKDTSYFGEGGHTSIFLDGTSLVARLQTIDASIELNFSGVSSGEEYEVAVTFGPNGVELWVDGNLVDSDPTAISWENNPEDMHWGQRNWSSKGPDAPFNGVIADKQIYAQVLTASQIAALAANSSATNDQPVAVDDVAMLDEDSGPLVIDVAANDTDSDGGTPVANAIVAGPANGTADVNPDGTVSYDPDPDFNGVDTFTVEIADGQGGFDTSLVTVTVNPVEDDPVANDDLGSTQEGVAVDIDVLANDTDGDGDTLSVIAVGTAGNGTVLDNGDGTVTYTPNGGFTGTDMFTYEVSDGDGPTDTATVTVEVTPEPVDNPPVANDDAAATTQGVAVIIDLLGNDTDADGDPLEIDMIGVVANGEVVDNGDGTVTYTPDPDFVGTEIFTYVASDGDDLSNTATVTVDVTEEPDFPEPIFQLAGVNAYGGSSANVDNFAHETVFEQEAITLAFSFIADSFSRRDGLITKDASGNGAGGHFAALLNGDDLDIRIQDASDSYTLNLDNLNAGQEYEVAVVITNDVAQLWVDGALIEETTSIDATWDTNTEYLNIGANGWASDPGSSAVKDGFDGAIADVEIYAQQLSEDQIQELAALSSLGGV